MNLSSLKLFTAEDLEDQLPDDGAHDGEFQEEEEQGDLSPRTKCCPMFKFSKQEVDNMFPSLNPWENVGTFISQEPVIARNIIDDFEDDQDEDSELVSHDLFSETTSSNLKFNSVKLVIEELANKPFKINHKHANIQFNQTRGPIPPQNKLLIRREQPNQQAQLFQQQQPLQTRFIKTQSPQIAHT